MAPSEPAGSRDAAGFVTSRRGSFWTGIERVEGPGGTVVRGPMFVEWEEPAEVRHGHGIVLVHGGGGQGLEFQSTPDGRPGWAPYLVEEGYRVYVVDRPGHGRASFHPDVLGPMAAAPTYERAINLFTAAANGPMNHPTAELHTQWPGTGQVGDPALDAFLASQGPRLGDIALAQALEQSAGAELLDRIGPAVLLTQSAGGPSGWLIADARPELVRAIVAVEPLGPPFLDNRQQGISLDWGVTQAPMTFDPPVADPSELRTGSSRRLANLQGIPIAVVSAEASWFSHQDGQTVEFLRAAGCDAEHVRLAEHGVHGNGHLMMIEKNNREVLQVILDWLVEKLPAGP